ncbi:MAG: acetolactate synthase-1/2/3 large subunit [Cellvibrionaceae bacterium]|jgi:acetolactate synthase-1/2/3 large subunit
MKSAIEYCDSNFNLRVWIILQTYFLKRLPSLYTRYCLPYGNLTRIHFMEKLSGASMIVRSLIDEGVSHIFGYPGGSVLDIYDSLHKISGIEHILVRHEQAAVHMADGYARATGKVGVVLVTSGPGATNAITGIATAYMDSIPLVVLSGQVPSNLIGNDAFQECDMIGISRPIVKHSFLITDAKDIPETVKKAFFIAATGRPGPVVIDLPKDCLSPDILHDYVYPDSVKMRSYNPTTSGHKGQIRRGLQALLAAKKPVLYVGGGAIISGCDAQILALAERLNIPVVSTLMGLGAFPGTHKQSLGMLGMHGLYEANMAMHNTDLIFGIGVRFDDRTTNNVEKYCPNATILHIDIDPSSISKTVRVDIPIVGSADNILDGMLDLLDESKDTNDATAMAAWWSDIEIWRSRKSLEFDRTTDRIKPQQVIETLYKLTNGDAYVASDVGQHQMFAALYYPFDKPRRWINSGGLGTMGFGLPAAMGVKMAFPEATVVCVTGDGSIQMNIQELSTALQYDTPVKIINLNNRFLGMVKQWQDMIYSGRHSHSYMDSVPNFAKIAEAYGHVGMNINHPDELESKLAEALAMKDKLVFVDISVDETEHVYPMLIRGGAMNEMWLSKTEKS